MLFTNAASQYPKQLVFFQGIVSIVDETEENEKKEDIHLDSRVDKKILVEQIWQKVFSDFIVIDKDGFLEQTNLKTVQELAHAQCLLELPSNFSENLKNLYKKMLQQFDPAMEIKQLGPLSVILLGQQS